MQVAWAAFRDCGWASWLCLLIGFAGTGAGIVGVGLLACVAWRRGASAIGVVALALGVLALGSGLLGRQTGLGNTEAALASAGIDPSQMMRIRAEGAREANQCVFIGAGTGAVPFVLGAITVGIGLALRRESNG
jgi:hypothetical protein